MRKEKDKKAETCDTQFCNYQDCGTDSRLYKQSKKKL